MHSALQNTTELEQHTEIMALAGVRNVNTLQHLRNYRGKKWGKQQSFKNIYSYTHASSRQQSITHRNNFFRERQMWMLGDKSKWYRNVVLYFCVTNADFRQPFTGGTLLAHGFILQVISGLLPVAARRRSGRERHVFLIDKKMDTLEAKCCG